MTAPCSRHRGKRNRTGKAASCQTCRQETPPSPRSQLTGTATTVYIDEWRSYEGVGRTRHTVSHGSKEWARDDDGDGIREVHVNTIEGLWTLYVTFCAPFEAFTKVPLWLCRYV